MLQILTLLISAVFPFTAHAFTAPSSPYCALTNKVADTKPGPQVALEVANKLGLKMIRTQAAHIPFSAENRNRPYWKAVAASGLKKRWLSKSRPGERPI